MERAFFFTFQLLFSWPLIDNDWYGTGQRKFGHIRLNQFTNLWRARVAKAVCKYHILTQPYQQSKSIFLLPPFRLSCDRPLHMHRVPNLLIDIMGRYICIYRVWPNLAFLPIYLSQFKALSQCVKFFEIKNSCQPQKWDCHENGFIKTILTTPHNLCGLSPAKTFTVD